MNKPTSKKYSKYKLDGDSVTKIASFCPRCGPGVFLSASKERKYCGKCHYTEFSGKPPVQNPSDKPAEKKVVSKK